MRSTLPSRPPSQPPPYRQLGSGGQQPVRIQLILGLIVGLVLVAVPLYLWRRPEPGQDTLSDAGVEEGGAAFLPVVDAAPPTPMVKLSPFTMLSCHDGKRGQIAPERCDHITAFEEALSRAIREADNCAPKSKTGEMVSFLFEVNFRRKRFKLKRGKSSTISKSRGNALVKCVRRAMPALDLAGTPHQHRYYLMNVKATYPPTETF